MTIDRRWSSNDSASWSYNTVVQPLAHSSPMTFEEQIATALEVISVRLRDEVARVGAELTSAAVTERARLADGLRSIGEAGSLSEVLDTLVNSAPLEASRTAILLSTGERFRGWRFVGFGPTFDQPDLIDVAPEDAGVISRAFRTGRMATTDGDNPDSRPPTFADLPAGSQGLALPIAVGGQVVAVLYADRGKQCESKVQNREPGTRPFESPNLEILVLYAARCLEALTAFRAGVLTGRPQSNTTLPASTQNKGVAPTDTAVDDEDGSARRYARLLVSEIKLYHEPEVVAGRAERDLAIRLGGEIARARVLFEQRVPAHVRQRGDYFHAELVRTLANGDSSLLELRT